METTNLTNDVTVINNQQQTADEMIVAAFDESRNVMYCSFAPETLSDKAKLYNAINNPDVQLSDHIGNVITMRDIIIQPVEITSEKDGSTVTAPRVTIIDTDGNSYSCTSIGVYNALRNIVRVFGRPTWTEGLPVVVRQINRGSNRILTLDAAF